MTFDLNIVWFTRKPKRDVVIIDKRPALGVWTDTDTSQWYIVSFLDQQKTHPPWVAGSLPETPVRRHFQVAINYYFLPRSNPSFMSYIEKSHRQRVNKEYIEGLWTKPRHYWQRRPRWARLCNQVRHFREFGHAVSIFQFQSGREAKQTTRGPKEVHLNHLNKEHRHRHPPPPRSLGALGACGLWSFPLLLPVGSF